VNIHDPWRKSGTEASVSETFWRAALRAAPSPKRKKLRVVKKISSREMF
jgi:hypothetical protein